MNLSEIQKSLPEKLAEAISGCAFDEVHLGLSPSKVFRLTAKNKPALYLKSCQRGRGISLLREKTKLDWLKNRLPVPECLIFAEDAAREYLLLSEIPGVPATDDSLKNDTPNVIGQSVEGLKLIHAIPTENCPFRNRLDHKIELARTRMLAGLVEKDDFDDERLGRTAAEVFEQMLAARPASEDLAFTHGDYCAPNIILDGGRLSGFVDCAETGVADRYQDLALLSRSVRYNFGEQYENAVFESYGIEPDQKKIHFYRLLDEFF